MEQDVRRVDRLLSMLFSQELLHVGAQAPGFCLLDQRGLSVGLEDFAERSGVALIFFASDWLRDDVDWLRQYAQAHEEFTSRNIALLGVSGINWETIHGLAQRVQVPFPLLFDPCCRYSTRYGAMWIPKFLTGRAAYALTPQGQVLFARKGAVSPLELLSVFNS